MQLYKTSSGNILHDSSHYEIEGDWDELINRTQLHQYLRERGKRSRQLDASELKSIFEKGIQAPIGTQEVWAAGVTYLRSRDARMEESKESGGSDFYSKVYGADRPELFFKALPHRVSGHESEVYIRKDSTWNVPEPELTLYINSLGEIQAYTIGNDMSSRSIEGENPLYLPQAKSYEKSCALGPCLYIPGHPISPETNINIMITRGSKAMFDTSIQLNRMKRTLPELAGWLFKELVFPKGCFLMTGTGLVPGNDFTLNVGDEVTISIDGIGILKNKISTRKE